MGLLTPFHVGSSWTRDRTHVPCIGRWILNHWTTREVPSLQFFVLKFSNYRNMKGIIWWIHIHLHLDSSAIMSSCFFFLSFKNLYFDELFVSWRNVYLKVRITFLKFYFIFNFTILYWFCHISIWICHRHTRVLHPESSSILPPCTIPLGEILFIMEKMWTVQILIIWNF